ncbi:AHBA synthesis associated protein [Nocardioides zeae]|uniref:AHBA synthesis associated protein n=1 Tax=Nocardioides zeae TaxID=1457234 RepID=A0ACC6ICU2_9ACTN|nr:HAD-IA family hydrolase [Nocardioides zeae]MDR6175549.1 AHBA synthesis associated protein [Nocardioides zeae]MDR6208480.1 AHBA synthesis associated protein [Nocardioides zeae]
MSATEPARDDTGAPAPAAAVLFDMDGVLVDSLEVMRMAYTEAVADLPGAPDFGDYQKNLGRALPDIAARLGLPDSFPADYRRCSDARSAQVTAYPGIREVLGVLRDQGVVLGVVTGKEGDTARDILERLELLTFIDAVRGGDEVVAAKPSPEHVQTVLRDLPCRPVAPSEVLVVGDSDADMMSARSAGCRTAFAKWGYSDVGALSRPPDHVLRRPLDVLHAARCRPEELC